VNEVGSARRVGRYELLRELGSGGMATVFLARQLDLNRLVALKRLGDTTGQDPTFALRFIRESRLAGSLAHPNVVTVFDFIEEDGAPYIAMELMQRGNLRPYIEHGLTLAQIGGVLSDTLAGLAYAERLGVVHRDLKPENLMVSGEGAIKIADFGIAKAVEPVLTNDFRTETGTTIGTPAYMAPEQAMGQEVGPWTDLYSVGCIAYEILAGQRPFADVQAPMAVMLHHVNEVIPPAASVNPKVPGPLSDWIGNLLVKDVTRRTRRAEIARDELDEILTEVLDPRWRRRSALAEQVGPSLIPGPYTPPPRDAVERPAPTEPVYRSFTLSTPTPPPAVEEPAVGPSEPVIASPSEPVIASPSEPVIASPSEPVIASPSEPIVATPPERPHRRRRLTLVVLSATVAAAVVAGVLAGRSGAPPAHASVEPLAKTASNAQFALSYPTSWHLSEPSGAGRALGLRTALAIAPPAGGDGVEAGMTDATDASLLPDGLGDSLDAPLPNPQRVRLGTLPAYRYAGVRLGGRPVTLFTVPTNEGVLTIVSAGGSDAQRIVSSLRPRGARALALGADPAYAGAVSAALAKLNRRRAAARTKLRRATGPKSQAAAATDAADAYGDAATALKRADPGLAETPLHASMLKALAATRTAYSELGRAAAKASRSAYDRATSAITRGEREVSSALTGLRALGYTVGQPADQSR
jgi:serine/threonine protein kinase